jgi:hypothetical protein
MRRNAIHGVAVATALAVALPPPSFAQPSLTVAARAGGSEFNVEQLDAILAPIELSIRTSC